MIPVQSTFKNFNSFTSYFSFFCICQAMVSVHVYSVAVTAGFIATESWKIWCCLPELLLLLMNFFLVTFEIIFLNGFLLHKMPFLPFSYSFIEYFCNFKIKGLVGCCLPSLSGSISLFPLLVGDHSNPMLWKALFPGGTSVSLMVSTGTFLAVLEMPLRDLAHFCLDENKKISCKWCTE